MTDSRQPPVTGTTARILVVDDDHKILDAVRRGLTMRGYGVITADNGADALRLASLESPDLVILDIMMPVLDGLEVCRRLRETSDVPILMLTARDEVSDRVRGLEAGADDYLAKPFAFEELLARIKALLRRSRPEPREDRQVLRFADVVVDTATREVRRGERLLELTPREYDLLLLFLHHPRQVLSRDFILERIWGFAAEVETHVLEVYIGYLRQKLEAGDRPRLIHTVRGAGYVLKEAQ